MQAVSPAAPLVFNLLASAENPGHAGVLNHLLSTWAGGCFGLLHGNGPLARSARASLAPGHGGVLAAAVMLETLNDDDLQGAADAAMAARQTQLRGMLYRTRLSPAAESTNAATGGRSNRHLLAVILHIIAGGRIRPLRLMRRTGWAGGEVARRLSTPRQIR